MRLASFIKKNKTNWQLFEDAIANRKIVDPEKLADLYIEISDDLSYASTFYPDSEVLPYLNNLASKAHQLIYKNKKEGKNNIINFYKTSFPLEFYHYQKYLLISFLVFVFFLIVGWYSTNQDSDFVRLILGDSYVNMTLENIKNNDPMAVYKQSGSFDMFLGITINNIMVAFNAFIYGILLQVGTLYVLMFNGVMLGSFLAFFANQGLMWESFRTIWIHGVIEISVIIVAGSAGLVLGAGILFPKTYTRIESLKLAGEAGMKIMISTIPFFIIAGFLEGFVTRLTQMPDFISIAIIISSLILVLYYYVYYPIKLHNL